MASKDDDKVTNELGDQLKKARENVTLTQAEVASAVGVHVNFYARVERGVETPSIENLQKIMKVLKIKKLNITSED